MLSARAFANVSAKHLSHSQKPESPKMKEEDAESPQIKTDEEVTTWTFEFGPSQSETDDKDVSEKHLSHSQKRVSPKTDEEVTTWTFEFCPSQSENDDKGVSEKHLSQCQMSVSSNIQEEEETGSLQIKKEAEEVNVTKLTLLKVPSKSDNYDKDVSGLPETPHIKKEEEQFPYINEERVFSHNEERENREVPYIKEEYEMNITDLPLTCGPLKTENKDNVPIIETIQALPPSTSSNDMKDDDADSCGPSQAMEFTVTTRGGRKLLYNGYAYTVDKMRDGITYWKCEGRRSCGGRLKTVNDILLGLPLPHCHRPDPSRIVVLKTVQKMKERASNTQEITSTLIENIQALPPSTSSNDMKDDADRCGPSRAMEFTVTKRGGRKLLYNGYAYTVDKMRDGITYWKCEGRRSCGGRLKTVNDILLGLPLPHCHRSDPSRVVVLKTVQEMKERASNTQEITSALIQNCTSNIPLEATRSLPKKEYLSRMIRRQRKLRDGNEITDEHRVSLRGERFVLVEEEDIILMATDTNLDLLAKSMHWFCDGTFDRAPDNHQLYTIHAVLGENHTVPLVYCITKSKTQETYDTIFSKLKEWRAMEPNSITVDFDKAAISSIEKNFPNSHTSGCFFHFSQCFWREIQARGLQNCYIDPMQAFLIKKLRALAFVPKEDVLDVFNELIESLDEETDEVLGEFLVYFETTWLGAVQMGRRCRPCFDISLWNVREKTLLGIPSTQNSVEGWHHTFQRRLSLHPDLPPLMTKLKKEQNDWELTIQQASCGIMPRNSKKRYAVVNEQLKKLMDDYANGDRLQYLQAIAQNL
ncbi:uncharacterized protein LOC144085712 isoform X2 [Stigmatopora argus]